MRPQHFEIQIASGCLPTSILHSSNSFSSLDCHDPVKRQVCHVISLHKCFQRFQLCVGSKQAFRIWTCPASQRCVHHAFRAAATLTHGHHWPWVFFLALNYFHCLVILLAHFSFLIPSHPSDLGSIVTSVGIIGDLCSHGTLLLIVQSFL